MTTAVNFFSNLTIDFDYKNQQAIAKLNVGIIGRSNDSAWN